MEMPETLRDSLLFSRARQDDLHPLVIASARPAIRPPGRRRRRTVLSLPLLVLRYVHGLLATLLGWLYFTLVFALVFSPLYLAAALRNKDSRPAFQRLSRLFYKGFFGLLQLAIPRFRLRSDPAIGEIRASVVICNHLSYLDPLLLLCLLERPVTIVKGRFFRVPVLSWVMAHSGYIPADGRGKLARLVFSRLSGLGGYLASGGNLFVFPEGTRSRPDRLGSFLPGAFKLARRCRAPLELLYLRDSQHLFPPRGFVLQPWTARTVTVERLARLEPERWDPDLPLDAWIEQVRGIYLERISRETEGS